MAGIVPRGPAPEAEEEPVRRVVISPAEVLQAEPRKPLRWRERSFFAPVLLVVAISAAFLYGLIALSFLLWKVLRG